MECKVCGSDKWQTVCDSECTYEICARCRLPKEESEAA